MHPPVEIHDLDQDLPRAAEILRAARSVAVLTGAGVSAESGVPTFRGADGLWEGHRVEEVATPAAFSADPVMVWRFYNMRRDRLRGVAPNPGHLALARLEQRWGERFALITQNVDNLHRRAGSRRVWELHGNLHRTRCTACARVEDRGLEPLGELPRCPHCGGLLRPDIVWFHETLPEDVWEKALLAVHECECLLVVGTSAVVYPAAGLIPLALRKEPRARVIEVNLEPAAGASLVDVGLYGPSGEVLPRLAEMIFGTRSAELGTRD